MYNISIISHLGLTPRKFNSLDSSIKNDAWRAAVMGLEQHTETLAKVFSSDQLDTQDKLAHLNAMQVGQFISLHFM